MCIKNKIVNSYRKNKDDVRALITCSYPTFIYRETKSLKKGEIPVFTFHSVISEYFEEQMKYLSDNRYRTLRAGELYAALSGEDYGDEKVIALTFDDGLGNLWTTAYPILKKYGLSGISFINPGNIREDNEYHPNLADVWDNMAKEEEIFERESSFRYLTWREIIEMHLSGTIDFQSHTLHHNSVFVSDKIVDFVNPNLGNIFTTGTCNPMIRQNGKDVMPEGLEWGFPIYQWGSMMGSEKRYLEDEGLSERCIQYVRDHGGKNYFKEKKWRERLKDISKEYKVSGNQNDHFQTEKERYSDMFSNLLESKRIIEEKLNKEVKHLCYPWYEGSKMSILATKEAGYTCNYWGICGSRTVNYVGENHLYHIVRIDDDYILALPGSGRTPLPMLLGKKIRKVLSGNRRNANKIVMRFHK